MHILITGICGFVGNCLARELASNIPDVTISGIDNLSRPGSELNLGPLRAAGFDVVEGDIRSPEDLDRCPRPDWVIDAAADPSVLSGIDGAGASFDVMDNNLIGTIRLLELCKRHQATFTLLSTSRVYAIEPLAALPMRSEGGAYVPDVREWGGGLSMQGVAEDFSTEPPLSLYGASKRASEILALEYGSGFGFPVWVNRCGVLAGAGQFGKPDQGIFSFWINSYLRKRPLKYIGFGGSGAQVRDVLHPRDIAQLLERQYRVEPDGGQPRTINLSGGRDNAMSLAGLTAWCARRFGFEHPVEASDAVRRFDLPWVVLDSRRAERSWDWRPETSVETVLGEIADHALAHPEWLDVSGQI